MKMVYRKLSKTTSLPVTCHPRSKLREVCHQVVGKPPVAGHEYLRFCVRSISNNTNPVTEREERHHFGIGNAKTFGGTSKIDMLVRKYHPPVVHVNTFG